MVRKVFWGAKMISLDIWERLNILNQYLKSKGSSLKEHLQNESNVVEPMASLHINGVVLEAMELEFDEKGKWVGSYYVPHPDDNVDFDYYLKQADNEEDDLTITTLEGTDGKTYYVVERKF